MAPLAIMTAILMIKGQQTGLPVATTSCLAWSHWRTLHNDGGKLASGKALAHRQSFEMFMFMIAAHLD